MVLETIAAGLLALAALLLMITAVLLLVIFHRQNQQNIRMIVTHGQILNRLLDMMEKRIGVPEYMHWPAAPEEGSTLADDH